MKWREAIERVLADAPKPGLVHYLDLTAAVADRWPEFRPSPGRLTPQNTVWSFLLGADDFSQAGKGWFRYHPWDAAADGHLALSTDHGAELLKEVNELKLSSDRDRPSVSDAILNDPDRSVQEAGRRAAAIERARGVLERDELTTDDVAALLRCWTLTGGADPAREYTNRFGVAFKGVYLKRYQEQLSTLNEWVLELRTVSDAEVPVALDRLWSRSDLDMAGAIFPTMVLHTLNPERWFPWTANLAKGLVRLDPTASDDFSGAGYVAYCQSIRALIDAQGVSAHLADLLLASAASEAEQHDEDADEEQAATGFSEAGFELLADLATTPNVRKEWFEAAGRRTIWQNQIRQPLAELVARLGRDLIVPLVNQSDAIAPDRLVVEAARTMGKPNSQSARANGSYYYPYLWAAFFPESQTRRQVAGQLFVLAHSNGIDVGVALSSAPAAVRERFRRNLTEHAGRMGAHLRSSPMATRLAVRAFTLDQGPVGEGARLVALTELQVLATQIEEPTPSLVVHWPRSEVVSATFESEVDDAVRVLLPFLLLATVDQVAPALDALGLPAAEDEPEIAEEPAEPEPQPTPAGYPLERLLADTHLPRSWLEEVVNAAKFEKDNRGSVGQVILYGPPGTGKTWLAERIALHLADGERGRVETVQFHPAFAYEHFVEGFQPDVEGGNMVFRRRKGVLRELADRVVQTGKRHVLVIDEINRGDLPQIFGELMYLLSRRGTGAEVRLGRSRDMFSLPDRLTIIGTMNTADRSIAHIDFALRRRFRFVLVKPEPSVLASAAAGGVAFGAALGSILALINDRLREALPGGGLQIGHAYLLGISRVDRLEEVWRGEVYPSIEDYLDYDADRLRAFEWKVIKAEFDRHLAEAGAEPGAAT